DEDIQAAGLGLPFHHVRVESVEGHVAAVIADGHADAALRFGAVGTVADALRLVELQIADVDASPTLFAIEFRAGEVGGVDESDEPAAAADVDIQHLAEVHFLAVRAETDAAGDACLTIADEDVR